MKYKINSLRLQEHSVWTCGSYINVFLGKVFHRRKNLILIYHEKLLIYNMSSSMIIYVHHFGSTGCVSFTVKSGAFVRRSEWVPRLISYFSGSSSTCQKCFYNVRWLQVFSILTRWMLFQHHWTNCCNSQDSNLGTANLWLIPTQIKWSGVVSTGPRCFRFLFVSSLLKGWEQELYSTVATELHFLKHTNDALGHMFLYYNTQTWKIISYTQRHD